MSEMRTIRVEVAFALADRQQLVPVTVAAGTTVVAAIERSGIAGQFPDQDISVCRLGIWGRLVDAAQVLKDGDRIEIYRPLNIDPRDARRRLAEEGKSMGGTSGSPDHKQEDD
jgi:putative ubiquitin-RnfH superfamily antitoxin RatB of RatAB toxin-antitoxin module